MYLLQENPDVYIKTAKLGKGQKESIVRTSDFLSLLFLQISHILSSWKDVLSFFWQYSLLFTAALLVGILPVLSQVWDLSAYFTSLSFLKLLHNEPSEVESCGKVELLVPYIQSLGIYLFEIYHVDSILNLSLGPSCNFLFVTPLLTGYLKFQ